MNISTKWIEILCLSETQRQRILQVRGNILRKVEKFKFLWVVLTGEEGRESRVIHGLKSQTQFIVP